MEKKAEEKRLINEEIANEKKERIRITMLYLENKREETKHYL